MNNGTLLQALSYCTLEEREQWALLLEYTNEKKAQLAHDISLVYFGQVIKAHYQHLLHDDPKFKAFLIQKGR